MHRRRVRIIAAMVLLMQCLLTTWCACQATGPQTEAAFACDLADSASAHTDEAGDVHAAPLPVSGDCADTCVCDQPRSTPARTAPEIAPAQFTLLAACPALTQATASVVAKHPFFAANPPPPAFACSLPLLI